MARPYLYRANRTAARISLYAGLVAAGAISLALVVLVVIPGSRYVQDLGWVPQDYERFEEVRLFADFLRIDTSPDTGNEVEGATFLASVLAEEGIESEILTMGERRANLIARLPGRSREALILHNHIDVEPILTPERWAYDPFGGEIDMPWMYGRGAFDMKSVTIAQLFAILQLKRSGVVPARDIVFLATSGEEMGSELGTRWLLEERPELFDEAWGLITEGGVVEARSPDDVKYWGTEVGQKRYVKVLACSPSKARLEDLRADIRDEDFNQRDLRVHPSVASFLDHYGPSRDSPTHRRQLARPAVVLDDPELFNRFAGYHRALFRNEISPFPVHEAADGSGYELAIMIALPPGYELEPALELLPEWMTHGVHLVVMADRGSSAASRLDHPILETINQLVLEAFGDVDVGPYYQMSSATDARFFREAGIASYGFSPFLVLTTDTIGIGGPNEGIALPAFAHGVQLYVDLLERLANEAE